MLDLKDYFHKFIKNHPTFPPHHNYTGWSHTENLVPVSWLDGISKFHDKDVKSSTIIGTFKNTSEQSIGNIWADFKFISRYLFGYLTLLIYPIVKTYKLKSGTKKQKWVYVAWNLPLDLIIGAFGVLLFTVNIILNIINLCSIVFPKIYNWVKGLFKK